MEEFKNSSLEISSNTIHGARIMTIHGSKGLEFEHVILVDRSGKKSNDTTAMIYNYSDDLEIDKVALRYAKRDNFDDNYQEILANRKELNQKDALNVLYVALTRAVSSMIIIKKPKESIFDMIDITPKGVLEIDKPKPKEKTAQSRDINISYYGKQNKKNSDEDIVENSQAINYGLALHYTLEMLQDLDSKFIESAMNSTTNRYGNIIEKDILADIKKRTLSLVDNIEFQNLLKDAKIYKEISISFEGDIKQIDLLLEYKNSYIVIDYKSSKKYHIKYIAQIKEYQKAIESITGKNTKAIIVYILDNGVEFVELV
ncbi:UvrD/REP helicase [hydrothermal vent metagenome]|uniref:UvrD/REP helicase n=1 Tax=hydrothermal vent metagenome TaxID=652676 RepID=A0A1W1EL95_9ZZZZ